MLLGQLALLKFLVEVLFALQLIPLVPVVLSLLLPLFRLGTNFLLFRDSHDDFLLAFKLCFTLLCQVEFLLTLILIFIRNTFYVNFSLLKA